MGNNIVKKPQDWEKVVSYAYLRITGDTQSDAARGVGVSPRTGCSWEKMDWFKKAEAEAHQRWLKGCDADARRGLKRALNDPEEYASTAKWIAERRIEELAPPTMRSKVDSVHEVRNYAEHTTEELLARIAELRAKNEKAKR